MGITNITLKLNPIFAAFITKGIFNSIRRQWAKKYGCKLKVLTSKNFSIMQAEWYNNTTGELIG
jgi:ribonuclease G